MSGTPEWATPDIDFTTPSVARVYDYYLGGSHNFESDRAFAAHVLSAMPELSSVVRDNRGFLQRVVRELSAQGIDQFVDLGSGIPTVGNVHEVAQQLDPDATIVYVDHDPVAVAHSRAILDGGTGATVVAGDIRDPQNVLAEVVGTGLVDLSRPVAVLLISVLHFIQDSEDPAGLVAEYAKAVVPGSYVALSHARANGRAALQGAQDTYARDDSPGALRPRTTEEVERLFEGLTLLDPGVVVIPRWRPEPGDEAAAAATPDDYAGLAGLGRRD